MIQFVINCFIDIISFFINFVFNLVDSTVTTYIPDVVTLYTHLDTFFDSLKEVLNWGISFTGLDSITIDLIVAYFVFITIANISVRPIKLALSYWETIVS